MQLLAMYMVITYNLSILDFKFHITKHISYINILIIYPHWILNVQDYPLVAVTFYLIIYPYWILNMKKRIIFAGSSMCICQPKIRSTAH